MHIRFYEKDGGLWFSCGRDKWTTFASGCIPAHVIVAGHSVIIAYAYQAAQELQGQSHSSRTTTLQDQTATEYPITAECDGVRLEGCIIPTDTYVTVRLVSPTRYAGVRESAINCFAAACAWNGIERKEIKSDGTIAYSAELIKRAQALLVRHYQSMRDAHGVTDVDALATALNERCNPVYPCDEPGILAHIDPRAQYVGLVFNEETITWLVRGFYEATIGGNKLFGHPDYCTLIISREDIEWVADYLRFANLKPHKGYDVLSVFLAIDVSPAEKDVLRKTFAYAVAEVCEICNTPMLNGAHKHILQHCRQCNTKTVHVTPFFGLPFQCIECRR